MAQIPGFCFARDLGTGVNVATQTWWRPALQLRKGFTASGLAAGSLLIAACAAAAQDLSNPESGERSNPSEPSTAGTASLPSPTRTHPSPTAVPTVSLRGWLSIVWNDQPHFFITSDDGQTIEILLDEQLTTALGGPLALDRTRVVVLAVVTQESPFQVLSIEREVEE